MTYQTIVECGVLNKLRKTQNCHCMKLPTKYSGGKIKEIQRIIHIKTEL
jgi:hypothetical protein